MKNANEMSFDEMVIFLDEAKSSGTMSEGFIYTWDTLKGSTEIVEAMVNGVNLISLFADKQENLTFESFCYQHKIEKQRIKEMIQSFNQVSIMHGTKTTRRNLSKKIDKAFSTFDFIFWDVINRANVSETMLKILEKELLEIPVATKLFGENCMRRFGVN